MKKNKNKTKKNLKLNNKQNIIHLMIFLKINKIMNNNNNLIKI